MTSPTTAGPRSDRTIDVRDEALAGRGAQARLVLRPIASTMPVGFLGLFIGTLALSAIQLQWIGSDQTRSIAIALLVTTVPMQAIAAVGGLLARDVVFTTAMASLTAGWAATGTVTLTRPAGSTNAGLGMVLVTTGACLTCCVLGAGTKLAAAAVLTAAALRFGFTGAYELTGSRGWEHTAGVTGAVLAALAFYAAAAALLEGAYRRPVLPMFRTGPGKRGQRGTLDDQLVGLHNEPGIRLQM